MYSIANTTLMDYIPSRTKKAGAFRRAGKTVALSLIFVRKWYKDRLFQG